jgi:hypothetical protein
MSDAVRHHRTRCSRLAVATLLGALVWGATFNAAPAVRAASPASAAAQYLATHHGGRVEDWDLVYARDARVPSTGEALWVGKFRDPRTGAIRVVYRDAGGAMDGAGMLRGKERAAMALMSNYERKASRALREAVQRGSAKHPRPGQPSGTLPVAAWLNIDLSAVEADVIARHPEVSWLGRRPLTDSIELIRQLRSEQWRARRDAIAAAADRLRAAVEPLGGHVAYVSTSAPLVYLDIGEQHVVELA